MKRILIVFMIIFSFHLVFATGAIGEEEVIDLEDAILMAIEENTELEIAELELENAEHNYQKNLASNIGSSSRTDKLNAEYDLANAEDTYYNTKNDVINEIIEKYRDLYLAEKMIKIREKSRQLEEIILEDTEKLVESGEEGELELLQQKNTLNTEDYDLNEARHNLRQLSREFRNLINMDDQEEIDLEEFQEPEIWDIEREEAVERVFENSRQLKLQQKNLELVEAEKNRSLVQSTPELDKKIMENDYKIAQLNEEETRESLERDTENLVFQFQQSIESIQLEKENLEEAEQSYEVSEQQYDSGLTTRRELLEVELQTLQADYDYRSVIGDYYSREEQLRQQVEPETEVLSK